MYHGSSCPRLSCIKIGLVDVVQRTKDALRQIGWNYSADRDLHVEWPRFKET
jgi:hypothetical protein